MYIQSFQHQINSKIEPNAAQKRNQTYTTVKVETKPSKTQLEINQIQRKKGKTYVAKVEPKQIKHKGNQTKIQHKTNLTKTTNVETKPNTRQGETKPNTRHGETKPNTRHGETKPNARQGETKPNTRQGETKPNMHKTTGPNYPFRLQPCMSCTGVTVT
jgi:hypothetical protein